MSETTALTCVLTRLLPPEGRHRDPCAVMVQTDGMQEGARHPLVLLDQPLMIASLREGDDRALQPLLDLLPTRFFLEESEGIELLKESLARLGFTADVYGPADLPELRWTVESYGEWTVPILGNGLTLSGGLPARVSRPGRAGIGGLTESEVEALVHGHESTLQRWMKPVSPRARAVVLEDLADRRWLLRETAEVIRRSPLRLRAIRESSGDPMARLAALEETVLRRLQGDSVVLDAVQMPSEPSLEDVKSAARKLHAAFPRRADDCVRETAFAALKASRNGREHGAEVLQSVEAVLGPAEGWAKSYRRFLSTNAARVVLIPTWQCELRCVYCTIGKVDGREMSMDVGKGGLDLLFSAPSRELHLAFFGGEPLLRWPLVRALCEEGTRRAKQEGRRFRVQITTNAWALTDEILDDLARWDTHLQLSIDGDPELHNAQRRVRFGGDSYANGPAQHLKGVHDRGIDYRVIMVITPKSAHRMAESFRHLVELGARHVQYNYAIGIPWSVEACEVYASGVQKIGALVEELWAEGVELDVSNYREAAAIVRNNLHVTVDFDGSIYGGNAFLFQSLRREEFVLGHLNDHHGWHRYMADGNSDEDVFANWKRRSTVEETRRIGMVEASFARFMKRRHPARLGKSRGRSA